MKHSELFDVIDELVNVFALCPPASTNTHGGVLFVYLLPNGETVLLAEYLELGIAEDGKLLVGRTVN